MLRCRYSVEYLGKRGFPFWNPSRLHCTPRWFVSEPFWSTVQIHIVLDNLSAHKAKAVEEFLEQNLKVRFHFTPTYSNQDELWLAKIQRDVIVRGVFTSVADLARKLWNFTTADRESLPHRRRKPAPSHEQRRKCASSGITVK